LGGVKIDFFFFISAPPPKISFLFLDLETIFALQKNSKRKTTKSAQRAEISDRTLFNLQPPDNPTQALSCAPSHSLLYPGSTLSKRKCRKMSFCCNQSDVKWKREKIPDHKFDYVDGK
jgi:hypothetical protein